MNTRTLSQETLQAFQRHLHQEEKSAATIEKYLRDVRRFWDFAGAEPITRELVIAFKTDLLARGYAVRSVNAMLASLNSLLNFLGWADCKTKHVRHQRQIYCAEEKELTRAEYLRLLRAAERQPRLHLMMQTICSTGIRISELRYFTVEAVQRGEITIHCKNKIRTILVPNKLRKRLLSYAAANAICSGAIFVTRTGKPIHRANVWAQMKQLCRAAGVQRSKVFPHNLRKLFARTFYTMEKDIARLADLLGHSSVDTTRIYIMTTGMEHRKKLEKLGLIL